MKLMNLTLALLTAAPAFGAEKKPYPELPDGSKARYQVPVSDDLKPFAEYPIEDAHSTEKNGKVQVEYTLPIQLTGVVNKIVLTSTTKSTNGTYTNFEGPNGSANCNEDSCNVRYRNLKIDENLVRQNFVAQGISGVELQKRMQVVAAFSGDPAGIVYFKK